MEQNPYGQDFSVDYLNRISGQQKTHGGPSWKIMAIAGAGIVIALIIFAITLLSSGSSTGEKIKAAELRIETLQSLAAEEQKNLRSGELSANNATFQLVLENSARELNTITSQSETISESATEQLTSENTSLETQLSEKFNEARLNVSLDFTYASEMTYQIDLLRQLLSTAYNASGSADNKAVLQSIYDNLSPIRDSFKSVTATAWARPARNYGAPNLGFVGRQVAPSK